ncbi:MAG: hypothetical protein D6737_04380 [Chloroflexi bacterium]|nr:MAG: hypothetical protein D6737_04380 [Chloroflexota bacterium]
MQTNQRGVPTPDLRIVSTDRVHPHEEHDSQRSVPLVERLREEHYMINPPIVAPMDDDHFVVLDGANRYHAFSALGYHHILVQVSTYESGYVELGTWRHVVSGWNVEALMAKLESLNRVVISYGKVVDAIAHIVLRNGDKLMIQAVSDELGARNAALRDVVDAYQKRANLYRTAIENPDEVWPLFPDAIALVIFPNYRPDDIMNAARHQAYIPPGISRHIVHGRALRVNYPLAWICDESKSLDEKNAQLKAWIQDKLARREMRYYAEATYQFDE